MKTDLLTELVALPKQFPGMEALSRESTYLLGCRSFEQFCCMIRAIMEPVRFCPFCTNELGRRNRMPIALIGEDAGWMVLENEFPHKNTRSMFLIVPQRHLTDASKITPQDWGNIGQAFSLCQKSLGVTDGGVMFRFGDPRFNVGTVEHLHFNIIAPICGKQYRAPFAKDIDEHIDDYGRLLGFVHELFERADILGSGTWLFSDAGIQSTQPAA